MTMKSDIIAAIQTVADETENTNIRIALGAFGAVLKMSTGQLEETGQALNESNIAQVFPTVIGGIARYLEGAGGVGPKVIRKIHSNYNVQVGDGIVQTDAVLTEPIEVTLPPAADFKAGNYLLIKDAGGVSMTNTLTITPSGAETIDEASSYVFLSAYAWVWLYSDGEKWLISSSN